MTLWLPLLDHARSYRPRCWCASPSGRHDACIAAPQMPRALLAALEAMALDRVDGHRRRRPTALAGQLNLPTGRPGERPAHAQQRRLDRGPVPRPTDRNDGDTGRSPRRGEAPRVQRAGRGLRAPAQPGNDAKGRALARFAVDRSSAPCRCTTCLTIARPRPVPPVSRERLPSTGRSARSAAADARARCRCRCRSLSSPPPSSSTRQPSSMRPPSGV